MAIIKRYHDNAGYPHIVQVMDKDTPPEDGYDLGLNYRYWLETINHIPTQKAIKIANFMFKKHWYYPKDITNPTNRHDLYVLLKNTLGDEWQAKLILIGLVYELTKEENHGG